MKKSASTAILAAVLILTAAVSFFIGRYTAPKTESVTFYATIDHISGNNITVTGLPVNDINSRGQFVLKIDSDTILEWRLTELSADELVKGDTIAVTYTGDVLESYPAQILKVLKIQLLDDEK